MNKKNDPTKQKNDHATKHLRGGEGRELVPVTATSDELIDHGAAWTSQQPSLASLQPTINCIANKTRWDTWPSWELCLTSMDIGLFLMPEIDRTTIGAKRALACLSGDGARPSVRQRRATITVQGQNRRIRL